MEKTNIKVEIDSASLGTLIKEFSIPFQIYENITDISEYVMNYPFTYGEISSCTLEISNKNGIFTKVGEVLYDKIKKNLMIRILEVDEEGKMIRFLFVGFISVVEDNWNSDGMSLNVTCQTLNAQFKDKKIKNTTLSGKSGEILRNLIISFFGKLITTNFIEDSEQDYSTYEIKEKSLQEVVEDLSKSSSFIFFIDASGNAIFNNPTFFKGEINREPVIFQKVNDLLSLYSYWKLDEGTGIDIYDSSLNSRNGLIKYEDENPPNWVDGKFGKALEFEYFHEQRIDFGDIANWDRDKSFSISLWAKISSVGENLNIAGKNDDFAVGWSLGVNNGKLVFRMKGSGLAELKVETNNSFGENPFALWHHIILIYYGNSSPSGVKILVDNENQALNILEEGLNSSILNSGSFLIGKKTYLNWSYLGEIDEFALFENTLSNSDCNYLFLHGPNAPLDLIPTLPERFSLEGDFESSTTNKDGIISVDVRTPFDPIPLIRTKTAYLVEDLPENIDEVYGFGALFDIQGTSSLTHPFCKVRTGILNEEENPLIKAEFSFETGHNNELVFRVYQDKDTMITGAIDSYGQEATFIEPINEVNKRINFSLKYFIMKEGSNYFLCLTTEKSTKKIQILDYDYWIQKGARNRKFLLENYNFGGPEFLLSFNLSGLYYSLNPEFNTENSRNIKKSEKHDLFKNEISVQGEWTTLTYKTPPKLSLLVPSGGFSIGTQTFKKKFDGNICGLGVIPFSGEDDQSGSVIVNIKDQVSQRSIDTFSIDYNNENQQNWFKSGGDDEINEEGKTGTDIFRVVGEGIQLKGESTVSVIPGHWIRSTWYDTFTDEGGSNLVWDDASSIYKSIDFPPYYRFKYLDNFYRKKVKIINLNVADPGEKCFYDGVTEIKETPLDMDFQLDIHFNLSEFLCNNTEADFEWNVLSFYLAKNNRTDPNWSRKLEDTLRDADEIALGLRVYVKRVGGGNIQYLMECVANDGTGNPLKYTTEITPRGSHTFTIRINDNQSYYFYIDREFIGGLVSSVNWSVCQYFWIRGAFDLFDLKISNAYLNLESLLATENIGTGAGQNKIDYKLGGYGPDKILKTSVSPSFFLNHFLEDTTGLLSLKPIKQTVKGYDLGLASIKNILFSELYSIPATIDLFTFSGFGNLPIHFYLESKSSDGTYYHVNFEIFNVFFPVIPQIFKNTSIFLPDKNTEYLIESIFSGDEFLLFGTMPLIDVTIENQTLKWSDFLNWIYTIHSNVIVRDEESITADGTFTYSTSDPIIGDSWDAYKIAWYLLDRLRIPLECTIDSLRIQPGYMFSNVKIINEEQNLDEYLLTEKLSMTLGGRGKSSSLTASIIPPEFFLSIKTLLKRLAKTEKKEDESFVTEPTLTYRLINDMSDISDWNVAGTTAEKEFKNVKFGFGCTKLPITVSTAVLETPELPVNLLGEVTLGTLNPYGYLEAWAKCLFDESAGDLTITFQIYREVVKKYERVVYISKNDENSQWKDFIFRVLPSSGWTDNNDTFRLKIVIEGGYEGDTLFLDQISSVLLEPDIIKNPLNTSILDLGDFTISL